jgi:hypothetical protein
MKNLKNVVENLKQKKNKIVEKIRYTVLFLSLFLGTNIVFAEGDKEFFDAAEGINVPAEEIKTGLSVPQPDSVQNADKAIQEASSNGHAIADFFKNIGEHISAPFGKLQQFSTDFETKLQDLTHGNVVVQKAIVIVSLTLICLVIIVIGCLVVKKFMHSSKDKNIFSNQQNFQPDIDENIDNSDNDFDNIDNVPENNVEQTEYELQNDEVYQQMSIEQELLNTPEDISSAIKKFIKITE